MKPFNREKFLLFLLGVIFAFQAAVFAAGLTYCANNGGIQSCPELGKRYENTFNVMIATTLALLTGSVALTQRKPSVSDPALPLDEQPRQLPRRRSQGKTSEGRGQGQASEEQASEQASEQEQEKKQPPGKR